MKIQHAQHGQQEVSHVSLSSFSKLLLALQYHRPPPVLVRGHASLVSSLAWPAARHFRGGLLFHPPFARPPASHYPSPSLPALPEIPTARLLQPFSVTSNLFVGCFNIDANDRITVLMNMRYKWIGSWLIGIRLCSPFFHDEAFPVSSASGIYLLELYLTSLFLCANFLNL